MAEKEKKQYKKSLVNSYTNKDGQKVKVYEQNGVFTTEIDGKPVQKTTNQTQKSTSSKPNYKNTFEPYAEKPRYNTISDIVNYFKPNLGRAYGDRIRALQNKPQPPAGIESYGDRIKRLQDRYKPTVSKQTPTQKFIEQQKNKSTAMTNNLKPTPLQSLKETNNLKSTPSKTTAKPKATTTKVVVTLPDGVKTTGYINPKDNRTYYDKDFTKPLKTQGAKVTKIKGNKKYEYTRYKKFEELS